MIDDDCDPLPVGYIYLPNAFDLLRKRKHGNHPWWEQDVPCSEKADVSGSSWTKRFNAEWAEDVNELRESFAVGALTALRYDMRQRRDVQIDSDYWLSASDDALVFRTVRNPFDPLRSTCPYLSKADFEYWLAKSYPQDGTSLAKSVAAEKKPSKKERSENGTPLKKYRRWEWTLFRAQFDGLILQRGIVDAGFEPDWTQTRIVNELEQWALDKWRDAPVRSELHQRVARWLTEVKSGA